EYTLANIEFAKCADTRNQALLDREKSDRALRARGLPTLPSAIGTEKRTNPFLRCGERGIRAAASAYIGHALDNPVDVFAALRAWKNSF
ncbi:MAG: hydroxyacylglutathione hydrolase C-terminal domain-containing protein, partial [Burkholderiales bacterium]